MEVAGLHCVCVCAHECVYRNHSLDKSATYRDAEPFFTFSQNYQSSIFQLPNHDPLVGCANTWVVSGEFFNETINWNTRLSEDIMHGKYAFSCEALILVTHVVYTSLWVVWVTT